MSYLDKMREQNSFEIETNEREKKRLLGMIRYKFLSSFGVISAFCVIAVMLLTYFALN